MTIKKVKEIAYGDQTAVELDINGKWQKGYGTIVVIEGYKFIFVPRKYSNGINIEAYSLDSLKLFDSKPMSFITAWLQCATKEGFMEATAPLAIRISERFAELLAITPKDIDQEHLTVYVNKSWNYKKRHMFFQPTKNKYSNRVIKVDWHAMREIEKYVPGCPSDEPIWVKALSNEVAIKHSENSRARIVEGEKYYRIYNSTLNKQLTRFCEKAEVPRISIHSLRHTHASMLISAGVSIQSVAKRLGHGNTETTQRTYIHLLDDLAMKDDNKMLTVLSTLGG